MKLRSRTGLAATSVMVAAALILSGCHTSTTETTSSTAATSGEQGGNEDAAKLIHDAAEAMGKVTGLHLVLETQGKVPNFSVTKLEGDVSNQPQPAATGTATLTVGQQTVDAKIIYADGHLYSDVGDPGGKFTDFGDGGSIYDVSAILDPTKGLANVLNTLKDPKIDGTETVNGVATTKVSGTSSTDEIAKLAGARLAPKEAQTMPTTVWIASDGSNHVVKAQIVPVPDATITLLLSDWGKQVTATKPEVE